MFCGRRFFVQPSDVRFGPFHRKEVSTILEPVEDFTTWQEKVRRAKRSAYGKVVISRRLRGQVECPYSFFESLLDPQRHNFLLALDEKTVFVGSSPELLFDLEGNFLKTEALAGTRPFTGDPARDEQFRSELLSSPKERSEHYMVTQFIEQATGLAPGEIEVRAAGPVQHLLQRFEGNTSLGVQELLEKLHPTPAVAGAPASFIRQIEGFDRGWYAGALGVVKEQGARFAVAIRSALWQEGELTWYSGCGITEGSDPLAEWEETARKGTLCAKIST